MTASLTLRPMEGEWRVVVVDDVETMQGPAQEAFLKSLEEPPPFVVILMLVTDPDVLLSTVRSRCQIVQLQPVATPTISSCLRAAGLSAGFADELAELSDGLPGWSFRAANDSSLREARVQLQRDAARWVDSALYDRLVMAMQIAEQFGHDRSGVLEHLDILLRTWRKVLLLRLGVPFERQGHVLDTTHQLSPAECSVAELVVAVKSVQTCRSDLLSNVRPRLALESMVLEWPRLEPAT
jgi:DNA polymerase-3 subunit delta'